MPRTRFLVGLLAIAALLGSPPFLLANPSSPADPLRTVTYPVADLVVPVLPFHAGGTADPQPAIVPQPVPFVEKLVRLVQPASWQTAGGRGKVTYHPESISLVIQQTPEVHEHIANYLARLRRDQDEQVVLEVRVIQLREDFLERLGLDRPGPFTLPARAGQPSTGEEGVSKGCENPAGCLTPQQLKCFLEAIQGDRQSNILQAPKLTLLSGQQATVDISEQRNLITGIQVERREREGRPHHVLVPVNETKKVGLVMTLLPKVSADRRFVRLQCTANHTVPHIQDVPLLPAQSAQKRPPASEESKPAVCTRIGVLHTTKLDRTVVIPNGTTILLGGMKTLRETRREVGPPMLSKVPYLSRLYRNVAYGRETQPMYLAITARILTSPEESARTTAQRVLPPRAHIPTPIADRAVLQATATSPTPPASSTAGYRKVVADLMKAYDEACAEGHHEAAEKLARAALLLDPTCFSRSRR